MEHERTQPQRSDAVRKHEHDSDCDRQSIIVLIDDRRDRIGENELGGETGDGV